MQPRGALVLVAGVYLVLALAYALVTPPLEGFDALAYFKYAAYLRQAQRLPLVEPATVEDSYELVVQPPLYFAAVALATLPLPIDQAVAYAEASDNPYHDKSLTLRQTITLPTMAPAVQATLWVARLVSILGGLVTVLGAYALVRTLLPTSPWLAVATAAVTAFNPQFLFVAVSITNDAWAPAVSVVTLWLLARATHHANPTGRDWLLVGLAAGLAALTKYSCLLIAIPGLLLLWRYGRQTGWPATLRAVGWVALGSVLVAGWWYGRNLWLYGSPIPFAQMAVALPTMRRPEPMPWPQLITTIPWLFTSYWGVFVSILASPAYLQTTAWLMRLAVAGLLVGGVGVWLVQRALRKTPSSLAQPAAVTQLDQPAPSAIHDLRWALLFALVWFGVVFAGVLHWTRTITFGEQGRLLHAAAPALALLLVIGWSGWLPQRWRRLLIMVLPLLFIGLALWPLPTLQRAYSRPDARQPPLTPDRPLQANFAGGMQLLGVDLPNGAALAVGEVLPLTLFWQTESEIDENYTLFVHLADAEDQLLYQFDGLPDRGRHPTRQWQPGVIFADPHRLTARAVVTDTLATLSLGFYRYDDPQARQPVFDGAGAEVGDRLVVGQVRILATPVTPDPVSANAVARWERDIQLLSAEVLRNEEGAPTLVTLQWQATGAVQRDYTVFVQLLSSDGQVISQVDQPPQGGRAPTATWRKGETFRDQIALAPASTDWERLIVGLYDATGQRVRLSTPTPGQDFLILLEQEK